MYPVNFHDPQLQRCYDSNLAEINNLPLDLRHVGALIATCDLFRMLDGPHSIRAQEILQHLVSAELRPALRGWYQRTGLETERAAVGFRDELNKLTGERLEISSGSNGGNSA